MLFDEGRRLFMLLSSRVDFMINFNLRGYARRSLCGFWDEPWDELRQTTVSDPFMTSTSNTRLYSLDRKHNAFLNYSIRCWGMD